MSELNLDENYMFFLKKFGQPNDCKQADEKALTYYQDILPSQLLTYWQKLGWCSYSNGLIWMTNPLEYQDTLSNWLKGTSFENREDLSVIGRNAFGELYVWCKDKGDILTIVPLLNAIYFYSEKHERDLTEDDSNKYMRYFWGTKKTHFVDTVDESDNPLFERALKKLGALKNDEMYGLKHARMLGGSVTLDNLEIMKIDIYHDIARQMDDPEIVVIDTSN